MTLLLTVMSYLCHCHEDVGKIRSDEMLIQLISTDKTQNYSLMIRTSNTDQRRKCCIFVDTLGLEDEICVCAF